MREACGLVWLACGPGTGLDLVPRSPLNVVQMPAKANRGRSSLSANHTTSFFFVSGFGSGAYSAKLLAGTKQRFSALSHARQCGDEVLRMFVTGYPPARGGGGRPQRIIVISRSPQSCGPPGLDNLETRPASVRGCRHSG